MFRFNDKSRFATRPRRASWRLSRQFDSFRFVASPRLRFVLSILIILVPQIIGPVSKSSDAGRASLIASGPVDRGLDELRSLIAASGSRPAEADLIAFESKHSRTRGAALARFLRGYLHYTGQNYRAAVDALDPKVIAANSSLGDYALFYRAESEDAQGLAAEAARDYAALYSKYSDSSMLRDSRVKGAAAKVRAGDGAGAIKDLSRLAETGDAGAIYVSGQAREQSGDIATAIELYKKVYYYHPASGLSDQAAERLTALAAAPKDHTGSFEERRSRAQGLFIAKQYPEALKEYDALIAAFPQAEHSDDVQLIRGISLLSTKQFLLAVSAFDKVGERDPKINAEALYHKTDALLRSNQAAPAIATVDRLIARHNQSEWTPRALFNLASFLDKHGRAADSANRFMQLIGSYPRSDHAPEASYDLGWQAYQSRQYADCARILEHHLASYSYPESKFLGDSAFWAGKAEEHLGKVDRALTLYSLVAERYRYGYHGFIAQRRVSALGGSDAGPISSRALPGADLDKIRENFLQIGKVTETADGAETARMTRADDLEILGLADFAVRELNQALAAAPTSPKLNLRLAQLYSRRGDNLQATLVLRRAYPDLFSYRDSDLPREAWEIFFPLKWWAAIKEESHRYGLDPYVAAGLIRQESVFNPNAISRVGARGLMQLMSATGQQIAIRQGVGKITAADLYNPTLNIKIGMNYLSQMMGEFGRIEYASAAYNAGPGRMRQWLGDRRNDIDEWVENIPLSETRGYVQGVLRNAANYRRLYGG
jgi:soluble lytic murein transglycosylase